VLLWHLWLVIHWGLLLYPSLFSTVWCIDVYIHLIHIYLHTIYILYICLWESIFLCVCVIYLHPLKQWTVKICNISRVPVASHVPFRQDHSEEIDCEIEKHRITLSSWKKLQTGKNCWLQTRRSHHPYEH